MSALVLLGNGHRIVRSRVAQALSCRPDYALALLTRNADLELDRRVRPPVHTQLHVLVLRLAGSVTASRANEGPSRSTVTSKPSARNASATAACAVAKSEMAAIVVNRSTSFERRSTSRARTSGCAALRPDF